MPSKPIAKGTRLGAFEILELVGQGGMGAVYRARDTTLGRDVAVKLVPEKFAGDTDRIARFEREARLLASVNHPGIATIHGLEAHEGVRFLVMELVDGQTLAGLLARGPLPIDRTRRLFLQIADALGAAHAKGIVHRDLKPSNIMVGIDDRVKLLDFGLAKALFEEPTGSLSSQSPTRVPDTELGTVLGTAPYMSPEQARGASVDARTDVWAFGCCLFEALSGKRAFDGNSSAEILAAVLEREPDFDALHFPRELDFTLRCCLRKSASSRLHSITDARLLLEEREERTSAQRPSRALPGLVKAAAILALGIAIGAVASRAGRDVVDDATTIRFTIERPEAELPRSGMSVAISPDGRSLAWAERRNEGATLFVRSLDESEPRTVLEDENLSDPVFSPDGAWLAFSAGSMLRRISIHGGPVQTLGPETVFGGVAWGDDGRIYFADALTGGISSVPETGGATLTVTTPDTIELRHRWPSVLPGGKGILYAEGTLQNWGTSRIIVQPAGEPTRTLVEGATAPVYARTGHLLYAKDGALMAVPFDLHRVEPVGTEVPVLDTVLHDRASGAVQFSLADDGSLFYAPGGYGEAEHVLVWVDRNGLETPLAFPSRHYRQPRLSPDERKVAVVIGSENQNVWVYDLVDGSATRLTFEGSNDLPLWTLDGERVAFQSTRAGRPQVFWARADGSAATEQLTFTDTYLAPHDFTLGGDLLLVEATAERATDLLWRPADGGELQTFLATKYFENSPVLSPYGRFLAYRSDESGANEIYVQTFPPSGARWQISTEGGNEPLWSRDGKTIFYRIGRRMMAAPVTTEPSFRHGRPELLFEGDYTRTVPDRSNYDVSAAGRFLMIRRSARTESSRELAVVLHWANELARVGFSQ